MVAFLQAFGVSKMSNPLPDPDLAGQVLRFADRHGADHRSFPTGVAGLTLVRTRAPTALEAQAYHPLVCLVLQGRKESYLGRERVEFTAGNAVIISLDLPTRARVIEASPLRPYVALALRLDLDLVRSLALEMEPVVEAAEQPARAIEPGPVDAALVDAMRRLFALVDAPQDRPVLEPMIVREIHYRLLTAPHGGMLRRLAQRDSHASRIHRVLARIRGDCTTAFSVAELATLAGMSPSSFHDHFRAVTNTTPLQYIKDMRLLEARQRLRSGGDPVSSVAFAVGYESPTQFSREYARKFGVTPRADRDAA